LPTLPVDPPKSAVVRGNLLEELTWSFGEIDFRIKRFWFSGPGNLSLRELHNPAEASPQLDHCVEKALKDKVSGKRNAYQAYKDAGWRTLLVLELVDLFLPSLGDVAESFRRLCPKVDLALLDDIVLMQQTFDDTVECCWAYRSGEIRTPCQQNSEQARSLELP
jgi:hypothetical protein